MSVPISTQISSTYYKSLHCFTTQSFLPLEQNISAHTI